MAIAHLLMALALRAAGDIPPPPPNPPPAPWAFRDRAGWPGGETVRFAAEPSRRREAWAVEINQARPGGIASIRLERFERRLTGYRYDRKGVWTMPVPAAEAAAFFARFDEVSRRLLPHDGIWLDGTGFLVVHRRAGVARTLDVSNGAKGASGELSLLVLDVARQFTGVGLPADAGWFDD